MHFFFIISPIFHCFTEYFSTYFCCFSSFYCILLHFFYFCRSLYFPLFLYFPSFCYTSLTVFLIFRRSTLYFSLSFTIHRLTVYVPRYFSFPIVLLYIFLTISHFPSLYCIFLTISSISYRSTVYCSLFLISIVLLYTSPISFIFHHSSIIIPALSFLHLSIFAFLPAVLSSRPASLSVAHLAGSTGVPAASLRMGGLLAPPRCRDTGQDWEGGKWYVSGSSC